MNAFENVEWHRVRGGVGDWLDAAHLDALSRHPLEYVETEYPHAAHAADGPADGARPSERHPIFYGCFDWHSAVHTHWSLVRQLRLFDDHPNAAEISASIEGRLTAENGTREAAYLADHHSFENPYGWGWLLRLVAELNEWDDARATAWLTALEPLETQVVSHVETQLLTQNRPIRVGTHGNSAFALACVLDYARAVTNESLERAAVETTRRFYADDAAYPVSYEPLGWDFLSPALTEADLTRRVLDGAAFATWFDDFLPNATAGQPPVLEPVGVAADESDGMALHLVGLNLSRAWALLEIADALSDRRDVSTLRSSAERHATAGLERAFPDDYAGAHWLSSFVLALLTRTAGGFASA